MIAHINHLDRSNLALAEGVVTYGGEMFMDPPQAVPMTPLVVALGM